MFSATKGGSPSGYQISRSVRLRSSASAYFNRTPASAGDRQKFTISFWMKRGTIGTLDLFTGNNANGFLAAFRSDNTLYLYDAGAASGGMQIWSQRVFRDPSAWYHIVIAVDTTQATDSNRFNVYINGIQETISTWNVGAGASRYPSLNANFDWNNTNSHEIGYALNYGYFDGYLTEFNNVSGQSLPAGLSNWAQAFGETNPVTGVWQPKKYAGTYGTNGFYLNFSDNSAATAAAIGKDYSGNGNNWTPNNISLTAGVTYDSMLDVPTQWADGGNGRGNYCVLSPLITPATTTIVDGNLGLSGYTAFSSATGTMGVSSGKWYFEFVAQLNSMSGITGTPLGSNYPGQAANAYAWDSFGPNKYNNNTATSYGSATSAGDIVGVAFDLDSGSITFYKNNVSQGTAYTFTPSGTYFPVVRNGSATNTAINFGQRPFTYTPPSGFKALNTLNLPTPTILKGNQYFDATTYTGTGASLNVVNSGGMQPDFVWTKPRSTAVGHTLFDSVRGVTKYLQSNTTGAEGTAATSLTAFNSDGFTVNSDTSTGANGVTYVGWQWKEGATQGFDIVTYTGTGSATTVAHSLGVAPAMIIAKGRGGTSTSWWVYHKSLGTPVLEMNSTAASATYVSVFNNTAPTSSVFSVGTGDTNRSGQTQLAYLFAEVAGFSRFGSYTGNGSADGPFVFCGFQPRFVMMKAVDATNANDWVIIDTARKTFNADGVGLRPNLSSAEFDDSATPTNGMIIDALSNGFKLRGTSTRINGNNSTVIFAAFAANPFKNSLAF